MLLLEADTKMKGGKKHINARLKVNYTRILHLGASEIQRVFKCYTIISVISPHLPSVYSFYVFQKLRFVEKLFLNVDFFFNASVSLASLFLFKTRKVIKTFCWYCIFFFFSFFSIFWSRKSVIFQKPLKNSSCCLWVGTANVWVWGEYYRSS